MWNNKIKKYLEGIDWEVMATTLIIGLTPMVVLGFFLIFGKVI